MCIGKKVRLKPDDHRPEVPLAEPLVHVAAVDLRVPVVEAAEDGEHEAAEQHVVEVGDDEVGVGLLGVGRDDGVQHARESTDREHGDEPEREQHGGRQPHGSPPDRAEPVEDLHAGRDGDEHRREAERPRPRPARGRWRTCGAPTRPSRGTRSRSPRTRRPRSRTAACARRPGGSPRRCPCPGRIRMYTSGWPNNQKRC